MIFDNNPNIPSSTPKRQIEGYNKMPPIIRRSTLNIDWDHTDPSGLDYIDPKQNSSSSVRIVRIPKPVLFDCEEHLARDYNEDSSREAYPDIDLAVDKTPADIVSENPRLVPNYIQQPVERSNNR